MSVPFADVSQLSVWIVMTHKGESPTPCEGGAFGAQDVTGIPMT
jgi:hypothetical protein